jgi:hypothetical protein
MRRPRRGRRQGPPSLRHDSKRGRTYRQRSRRQARTLSGRRGARFDAPSGGRPRPRPRSTTDRRRLAEGRRSSRMESPTRRSNARPARSARARSDPAVPIRASRRVLAPPQGRAAEARRRSQGDPARNLRRRRSYWPPTTRRARTRDPAFAGSRAAVATASVGGRRGRSCDRWRRAGRRAARRSRCSPRALRPARPRPARRRARAAHADWRCR